MKVKVECGPRVQKCSRALLNNIRQQRMIYRHVHMSRGVLPRVVTAKTAKRAVSKVLTSVLHYYRTNTGSLTM